MTVKEIVVEYLKASGYDGLACEMCGCDVNDLMPCSGNYSSCDGCSPAKKQLCETCNIKSECESDAREDGKCYKAAREANNG